MSICKFLELPNVLHQALNTRLKLLQCVKISSFSARARSMDAGLTADRLQVLEARLDSHSRDLVLLGRAQRQLTHRVVSLESSIASLETRLGDLEADLEQASTRLAAINHFLHISIGRLANLLRRFLRLRPAGF